MFTSSWLELFDRIEIIVQNSQRKVFGAIPYF